MHVAFIIRVRASSLSASIRPRSSNPLSTRGTMCVALDTAIFRVRYWIVVVPIVGEILGSSNAIVKSAVPIRREDHHNFPLKEE